MIREWLLIGGLVLCPFGAHADDDGDFYYRDPPNEERHTISGLTFGNGLSLHDTTANVGLETRGLHIDPEGWVGFWDFSGRVEGGVELASPSPLAGGAGRIRFGMYLAPGAEGGCDVVGGLRANIEGEARAGSPRTNRFDGGVDATAGMFCVLSDDLTLLTAAELGPHVVDDAVGDELQVRAGARVVLAVNDDLFIDTAGGASFSGGLQGEIGVRGRVSRNWLIGTDITASDRSQAVPSGGTDRITNVRAILTATRGF